MVIALIIMLAILKVEQKDAQDKIIIITLNENKSWELIRFCPFFG